MPHWITNVLIGRQVDGIEELLTDESIVCLMEHGILPIFESQLRLGDRWATLSESTRSKLSNEVRNIVVRELYREGELRRVSSVLEKHGISSLLLKGNALGQWLYPVPHFRVNSDIDLLLPSRVDAEQAAKACECLGYVLQFSPADTDYEMTARLIVDGTSRNDLDLHWRLVDSMAFADVFSFSELWLSAVPLQALGSSMMVLSPLHALIHACMNRALDMQIGLPDRLKLLYDIHLMIRRMNDDAWSHFLVVASEKRICGVCLRSIEDTVSALESPVPRHVLKNLHRMAEHEPIDWRRLHDWRYMQWQNLRTLRGVRTKVRWIWNRIFPTTSHLRKLHGDGNWLQLMLQRITRGIVRLRNQA